MTTTQTSVELKAWDREQPVLLDFISCEQGKGVSDASYIQELPVALIMHACVSFDVFSSRLIIFSSRSFVAFN